MTFFKGVLKLVWKLAERSTSTGEKGWKRNSALIRNHKSSVGGRKTFRYQKQLINSRLQGPRIVGFVTVLELFTLDMNE